MWTIFKAKRLRFLTAFAGFAYAILIVSSFVNGWNDFKRGFYEGSLSSKQASSNISKEQLFTSNFLNISPKKGFTSYPDSLINLVNNKKVQVCYQNILVLSEDKLSSVTAKWYNAFRMILVSIILFTYFIIPIHFFQFMALIKRNVIFEKKNIQLLRWLGFELLLIYFGNVLYNFLSYKIDCSLFSFSDYKIVMDYVDGIWLLFGVVVLLIAEILSKALVLKEEQELTI